jgi:hypothetical protein
MRLLILLTLISTSAMAQEIISLPTNAQGGVEFQQVFRLADTTVSATDIISRARTWAAKTYRDSEKIIQQYDAQAGVMVLKPIMKFTVFTEMKIITTVKESTDQYVGYTLTIEARKGRYRATMSNYAVDPTNMRVPMIARNKTEAEFLAQPGGKMKQAARIAASQQFQTVQGVRDGTNALLKNLFDAVNAAKAEEKW